MLNPSVVELLVGVADGLRAEVLDALGPGPARDQVVSAIGIVRRVARALPGLVPHLVLDVADLQQTLRALGVDDDDVGVEPDPATWPLDELIALDLRLRDRLAGAIDEAELTPATDAALRAALVRLTEREAALRLSPWER